MRRLILWSWIGLAVCCVSSWVQAQAEAQSAEVGGVEVRADRIEFRGAERLLVAAGNVVVTRGADKLTADEVTFNVDTHEAEARGRVIVEQPGRRWQGERARYNFKTRMGSYGAFQYHAPPYYIRAQESWHEATNVLVLKNATFTTCEGDRPLVSLRMRKVRFIDDVRVRAHGTWLLLGPIPLLYMPYFSKRLDDQGWEFVPGRSSRSGYYLLSAYTFRPGTNWLSTTHIDYRTRRGWAVGQDFEWNTPSAQGRISGYYADDQEPFRDAEDEEKWREWVDPDRYRFRFSDLRRLSARDYVVTELNYWSDPRVLEDFFTEEFRASVRPENRVSLVHRGDRFTASLTLNKRLNDFFDNVNRLPEVRLDVPRMPMGILPLYYESENSAAWLQKEHRKGQETNDYDSIRLDSAHRVYYPLRLLGFLNVTPRAGHRLTYYSTAYDVSWTTNVVPVFQSNIVVGTTTRVDRVVRETDGLRQLPELGVEVSYKAFGVLHNEPIGRDFQGLRHVVEPLAIHTFMPEPNLRPWELPQFDAVDSLDRRHDVYFGVRNKLQTKRRGSTFAAPIHDFVDAGVFTTYRIEREEDEREFGDVELDARLRLVEWLPIDARANVDPYEGEVTEARLEASLLNLEDHSRLSVQHLYRKDRRNQVSLELSLFPEARWSFRVYLRQNLRDSELEEQGYYIEHKTQCLGTGVGYKRIGDDDQVWFQVWLTAFPKTYIKMGL